MLSLKSSFNVYIRKKNLKINDKSFHFSYTSKKDTLNPKEEKEKNLKDRNPEIKDKSNNKE